MPGRRTLPQVPIVEAVSGKDTSIATELQQRMSIQSSEFYTRQTTLPSVGRKGLTKLRSSTIAVVGVGGVGSSAAYYLARSGVGRIRLIDQDIIEPSNLQRIQSATEKDLFLPKAEVLSRKLAEFDSSIEIDTIVDTVTRSNVENLLKEVDLMFDGLDNFRTRYVLNRFATRHETPYLFASAVAEQAHLALLNPPFTPCLECIMPYVVDRFNESCENLGVSPAITGFTGAIGAEAAVQSLLGNRSRLTSHMMTIDLHGPDILFSQLSKKDDCSACQNDPNDGGQDAPSVTLLCGEHTANILPSKDMDIKLSIISSKIPSETILARSDSVIVYHRGPHTVSLFRNGRLLIAGVDTEERASEIAEAIWEALGKPPK
jgi:molybdopterin-synthase adenylyltransferase